MVKRDRGADIRTYLPFLNRLYRIEQEEDIEAGYVLVGGMAVQAYAFATFKKGSFRASKDVDIVVTREFYEKLGERFPMHREGGIEKFTMDGMPWGTYFSAVIQPELPPYEELELRGTKVRVLSLPYLVASKLAVYSKGYGEKHREDLETLAGVAIKRYGKENIINFMEEVEKVIDHYYEGIDSNLVEEFKKDLIFKASLYR